MPAFPGGTSHYGFQLDPGKPNPVPQQPPVKIQLECEVLFPNDPEGKARCMREHINDRSFVPNLRPEDDLLKMYLPYIVAVALLLVLLILRR